MADEPTARLGCALLSRQAEESLSGTASTVRRWILVEEPGPWGADAIRQSRLAPATAAGLAEAGRRGRARVLLIRRHGRISAGQQQTRRSAFAVVSTTSTRRVERFTFDDPAELLHHDWAALAEARPVGGEPATGPLFLVCTNGSHDACCAELGRPVAAALTAIEPEATWESSHFGGDRFAGNVVCLPDGLYYGRVAPGDAAALARATRERRLILHSLRGRSSYPFGVQAAEAAVRDATGLDGIDDLALVRRDRTTDDAVQVVFRDPEGHEHRVAVAIVHDSSARTLSCGATPQTAPRFETRLLTAPQKRP